MCSRDHLSTYAQVYPAKFILGYCSTYIFMQTFMIPGTIFMSLLAGALFGVVRGLFLVVFNATAGASSCYFLSKLIGRPIVSWLWPEKLRFFQGEVYMHVICFYGFCLVLLLFLLPLFSQDNRFADSKAERKVAQLHALSTCYSNIAEPVYQFGITDCGYPVSYFLSGNCYWSHPSFLHNCQGKTLPCFFSTFIKISWLKSKGYFVQQ